MKMGDYQMALDMLEKDLDWRSICFKLASKRPDIFISIVGSWRTTAKHIFDEDGTVAAVKYIRQETGCALAEAAKIVNQWKGQ